MKFMWESFDDVLQAELQGDNRFTDFLGRYRLWAVWPPLVTSDGKWPSQNSGEVPSGDAMGCLGCGNDLMTHLHYVHTMNVRTM